MKIQRIFHISAVRVVISMLLALAGLGPLGPAPRAAHAASEYLVDTHIDGSDDANDDICAMLGGGCSLRAAIEEAFDEGVPTTITFKTTLHGMPQVLSDTLGTILWTGSNITVTGGSDLIIVSGAFLTGVKSAIQISGDDNVLQNITVQDAAGHGIEVGDFAGTGTGNDNLIQSVVATGNVAAGVFVRGGSGGGGQRNRVTSSLIGLTNTFALGCASGEGNRVGVLVGASAIDTQITANLIGCSAQDGVSIDGSGSPPADTLVYGNKIGVNLAPAGVPNGWAGVAVLGGALRATVSHNVISGNVKEGLYVAGAATGYITVTMNTIGLEPLGAYAIPNGEEGIHVVGLPAAAMTVDFNVISGNDGSGIGLDSSAYVTITNNLIGLNAIGTTAWPNGGDGIKLFNGANRNIIGGSQLADRNTISGNTGSGVLIDGATTTLNVVSGNFIGTNEAGTGPIANMGAGVRLDFGAHHNNVGGTSLATARNVISGNAGDGVYFVRGAHDNIVDGNFIGLNATGLAAIGNGVAGVAIIESPSNQIGSPGAGTDQFISGNGYQGIYVRGSDATYIGWTNLIGVGSDVTTALGNGSHGIQLNEATNISVNAGILANNHGAGVAVTGGASAGNKLFLYNVRNNTGLPIDLNADGATPNDPGDFDSGPNLLQNYPAITAVAGSVVTGTACVFCTVFIYRAYGNPASPGGGGLYIGTAFANAAGAWTYAFLPPGLTRFDLSAAACDTTPCVAFGNTSEMSPRWQQLLPVVFR